ncbi:CheW protein [[Leptolyngbya] sp. PCC 7376]|uniref:chemotaxis protein CheW n=1 Tax=[Leptolyngbya] sp. PCC 7376 TaxID=111781 RepID=UPI00029EE9F6|nr:chemotaxis protein CheW [[Leptolyngbya] sp. PCC 7376]AFY37106.1 CheW protein [[Leptolyngbya] sp. PCC 7376]
MSTLAATADYFQVQLYPNNSSPSLSQTLLLIPLSDIAEIITVQQREICPLPGVPQGVTGVLNLRGQLIWTMDLRLLNRDWGDSTRQNPQAKSTLVLVTSEQGQIGCYVDSLKGIVNCHLGQQREVQTYHQAAYAFCKSEIELPNSQLGLLLDTPQLFQHLQNGR